MSRSTDFIQSAIIASASGASGRAVVVGTSQSSSCSCESCTGTSTVSTVSARVETGTFIVSSQTTPSSSRAKSACCTRGRANRTGTARVRVSEVSLSKLCDFSGEFGHSDRCIVHDRVDNRCFNVSLVDLLSGVVMLDALSLALDQGLHFFNDMLVNMLPNDRSIYARRMSLIPYSLLMLKLSLGPVPLGCIIVDLLLYVSRDLGRYVLVVGVDLLVVNYGLDFLVDFNFGALSVDDRGDFVVRMLEYILVNDGILDFSSVSSPNLVVYDMLCWLSECESSGSIVPPVCILVVECVPLLLVSQSSEYFVYDGHCCWG